MNTKITFPLNNTIVQDLIDNKIKEIKNKKFINNEEIKDLEFYKRNIMNYYTAPVDIEFEQLPF